MTATGNTGIDLDEVDWLFSFGWDADRVAERLGFRRASLRHAAQRAGRTDLVTKLDKSFDYAGFTVTRADVFGPNAGYKPRTKR